MRLSIANLAASEILAGAPAGRQLFAKLVEALPDDEDQERSAEVVYLDFDDVLVATASFLRESVLEFRNYARGRRTFFYPVIANASPDIIDELVELVQLRGDALLACTLDECGDVLRTRVIGLLDPMQKVTFDLLRQVGSATATTLRELNPDDDIKVTAWNNRLAALSARGLALEKLKGRTKVYEPVLAGGRDGN